MKNIIVKSLALVIAGVMTFVGPATAVQAAPPENAVAYDPYSTSSGIDSLLATKYVCAAANNVTSPGSGDNVIRLYLKEHNDTASTGQEIEAFSVFTDHPDWVQVAVSGNGIDQPFDKVVNKDNFPNSRIVNSGMSMTVDNQKSQYDADGNLVSVGGAVVFLVMNDYTGGNNEKDRTVLVSVVSRRSRNTMLVEDVTNLSIDIKAKKVEPVVTVTPDPEPVVTPEPEQTTPDPTPASTSNSNNGNVTNNGDGNINIGNGDVTIGNGNTITININTGNNGGSSQTVPTPSAPEAPTPAVTPAGPAVTPAGPIVAPGQDKDKEKVEEPKKPEEKIEEKIEKPEEKIEEKVEDDKVEEKVEEQPEEEATEELDNDAEPEESQVVYDIGEEIETKTGAFTITANDDTFEVEYSDCKNDDATTVTIPKTITIDGIKFAVTSIADGAFKGNKDLKKVTIGSNVAEIGAKAFWGCKNLKTIKISSKKLTMKNVGSQAFKKVSATATIQVPKSKMKSYKKIFRKRGLGNKTKFKAI